MHNGNTKWTALCSETETLLISWVCLGSAKRSRVQVPGTSECPKALRIMGSIKHHHRVQHGPGSLQYWSLLQPTTGIKNQLHTSVKAKHYRPSAALLLLSGGHTSRVWHPTQASQNCRARIVGPWLLTEPAPQPEHKQDTLITLPEVSYCSSCPATQAVTGSAAHPPASPQLHFLCRTPVRIPSCSGNKGREWLAAPFCISCFPLSSLTSDVRCHILYFIWNAVTSSCLTQAMANFLLQIICEGARLCNSPGSKSDRLQQSQPKTRERAQRNYRGWGRKCYIHSKII